MKEELSQLGDAISLTKPPRGTSGRTPQTPQAAVVTTAQANNITSHHSREEHSLEDMPSVVSTLDTPGVTPLYLTPVWEACSLFLPLLQFLHGWAEVAGGHHVHFLTDAVLGHYWVVGIRQQAGKRQIHRQTESHLW